jgi:hypothetical protein
VKARQLHNNPAHLFLEEMSTFSTGIFQNAMAAHIALSARIGF